MTVSSSCVPPKSMLLGSSPAMSNALLVRLSDSGALTSLPGTSMPRSTPLSTSPPSTSTFPTTASWRFHRRAISSSSFSPAPESRQSAPHRRPMNAHSSCSASLLSVRLCFLVKTRNAIGRRTLSGISTASTRGGGGADDERGSGSNGSEVRPPDDGGGGGARRRKVVSGVFVGGGGIAAVIC